MSTNTASADRLAELEEERAFLLRSLDDLDREHDAGDIDETDYVTLRDGYTARAAAVLRAIESEQAALPSARPRNWRRITLWAAVVVVVAVAAGVLVAWASGDRMPGDTSSGDIAQNVTAKLAEQTAVCSAQHASVMYQLVSGEAGRPVRGRGARGAGPTTAHRVPRSASQCTCRSWCAAARAAGRRC